MTDHGYEQSAAMRQYVNRLAESLGAEAIQSGFRKIYLRTGTREGYYKNVATIQIEPEGSLKCWPKDLGPTKEEAETIKKELADVIAGWPKSITVIIPNSKNQRDRVGADDADWYPCLTLDRKEVAWVQQRCESETTGDKFYKPWSFWSDHGWRPMEPDGPLTFWKENEHTATRVMIHEGPKAARKATQIADAYREASRIAGPFQGTGLAAHPWAEELAEYEHWGLMSGASAPERMDWEEVRKAGFREVVYVCDNDAPGGEALIKVSKLYRGVMFGIKFNTDFPVSWDMADPMPKVLFNDKGSFVGPRLEDLMVPGTWAVDLVPPEGGKGRPTSVLRQDFQRQWHFVVNPDVFINERWPDRKYSTKQFNTVVGAFSQLTETANKMIMHENGRLDELAYHPGRAPGIITVDGKRAFNIHVPCKIKAIQGDTGPWTDFLERLIPDPGDRREVMRWAATLIARPDIRMKYALLLASEQQGTGKSTLGWILSKLVGPGNYSTPTEAVIVDKKYNDFVVEKRLVIGNEIYAGNSTEAYNRLKDLITEDELTVSKKYVPGYQSANWAHILACSNSMNAIKLSEDDRRWLVPKVTELKPGKPYWVALYAWLEAGGLGIIRGWAEEFARTPDNVVRSGEEAPRTSAKRAMVEAGYSPGQRLVADWLDYAKESGQTVVTTDLALQDLVRETLYKGTHVKELLKQATIRKVARDRGWFVAEARSHIGPRRNLYLISTDPELAQLTWGQVTEEGVQGRPIKMIDIEIFRADPI